MRRKAFRTPQQAWFCSALPVWPVFVDGSSAWPSAMANFEEPGQALSSGPSNNRWKFSQVTILADLIPSSARLGESTASVQPDTAIHGWIILRRSSSLQEEVHHWTGREEGMCRALSKFAISSPFTLTFSRGDVSPWGLARNFKCETFAHPCILRSILCSNFNCV